MKPKTLRVPDYLAHILQAIHRIQRYTLGKTREAFMADEQLQDAVVRNIEIMGEAARNIETHSPTFIAIARSTDRGNRGTGSQHVPNRH